MLQAVVAALGPVCGEVVLLGPAGEEPGAAPARSLPDLRPGAGPLGGIETLLASGLADDYLVCPCDTPLLATEILRTLAAKSPAAVTAIRLPGDGRPQALPLRISTLALPAVREALDRGERAIHRLLARGDVSVDIIDAPEKWRPMLRNVNTPDDYERLCATLRRTGQSES